MAAVARKKRSKKITLPLTCEPPAHAAAFLLSEDLALTAHHCVRTAKKISIAGQPAKISVVNSSADLAILKLSNPITDHDVPTLGRIPFLGHPCEIQSPVPRQRAAHLFLNRVPFEVLKPAGGCIPLLELTPQEGRVRPGWSGAPVLSARGMVIGIVTQIRGDVVHAVPTEFITRMQEGEDLPLSYLPGLIGQPLISEPARRAARVDDNVTGMRVTTAAEGSLIRVGDVMVEVNGKKVSNSGTVKWGFVEATWQAAVCELSPGTSVPVSVLRDGELVTEKVQLRDSRNATAAKPWVDNRTVIAGQMMFMALSFELLQRWGDNWLRDAPQDLIRAAMRENEEGDDEVVVLVGKAMNEAEEFRAMSGGGLDEEGDESEEEEHIKRECEGWEEFHYLRVTKVDGERVRGLEDLAREERHEKEIVVEFANGYVAAVQNGKMMGLDWKDDGDEFDVVE